MESIEKYFTVVTRTLDRIGGLIVLPAITGVVIVDVALRYIFNSPFIWSLEFNEWALLLVFAFALPECTRQNGHIRMELLVNALSARMQSILSIVYMACGTWLFFLLARHEWEEFLFDYELDRITEYVQLPYWFHSLTLFVISIIMIFYFLIRTVAIIIGAKQFTQTVTEEFED